MTRIKTEEDAHALGDALADKKNILLILLGPVGSEAERVYAFASEEMTLEGWEKVFLVENPDALKDKKGEWFDGEIEGRYVCVYANTQKFTDGPVSRFFFHGD